MQFKFILYYNVHTYPPIPFVLNYIFLEILISHYLFFYQLVYFYVFFSINFYYLWWVKKGKNLGTIDIVGALL